MNLTDLLCLYCENICKAYMKVKQTHCLYNTLIKSVTQILSLIHSDIVDSIIPITYKDSKYFVTFTDNYVRFIWMYSIKKKKQTAKYIKVFVVTMKTHLLNLSVSHFCINYKCKYLDLKNWFSSQSIIWELTVTYFTEKNSVSEWVNCIICESARAMFKNSDINSFL